MVSDDTVDKSLVPLCLETWLSQITRNHGRNGFHLPNFNLTPGEISEISHKTWSIFLDVSEKSNVQKDRLRFSDGRSFALATRSRIVDRAYGFPMAAETAHKEK